MIDRDFPRNPGNRGQSIAAWEGPVSKPNRS